MIIKQAFKKLSKHLGFHIPYFLLLIVLVFAFTSLLSLSIDSKKIYTSTGSDEYLTVFESSRACVLASLVPEAWRPRIEAVDHVTEVTGEVRHLIVYGPSQSLTLIGIEPDEFRNFRDIHIQEKEYENFKNDPYGVIIGKKVNRLFKWKLNSKTKFQGLEFTVHGVLSLPLSVYNGAIIFHKEYLQELIKKKTFYTVFLLKVDSQRNKSIVSRTIEEMFKDNPSQIACTPETDFWQRTARQMGNFANNMDRFSMLAILLLFSIIVNGLIFRLKNAKNEIALSDNKNIEEKHQYWIYFLEGLLVVSIAAIVGSFIAFFIGLSEPYIGGNQATLPPFTVSPINLILSIFSILIFTGMSSAFITYIFVKGVKTK